MDNEQNRIKEKLHAVISDTPSGALTQVGRGYAKDTIGRVYRVTSLETIEKRKRMALMSRDKRHFSFSHMLHIREITRDLSNKYCGYVLLLQPYIAFRTNVIVHEGRASTPMKVADLASVWGVSKRTARTIVDELKECGILYEEAGVITINDRYHFRKKAGNGEVEALIKTYATTLKRFKLSAADLGFVYKLLPNIHYDTNLVCADPFATADEIRFLSDGEIGELVGMTERMTREALTRLRKAAIIGEWINAEDRREKFTALNPYVFYRKQGEPDGMLFALFAGKRLGSEN